MSADHSVRMQRRGWLVASALALLGCGQGADAIGLGDEAVHPAGPATGGVVGTGAVMHRAGHQVTAERWLKRGSRHSPDSSTCTSCSTASQTWHIGSVYPALRAVLAVQPTSEAMANSFGVFA